MTTPRCTIERDLGRGLTWQVTAPDGFHFAGEDYHAQVAFSRKEAETLAKEPLEACAADCSCKEEADPV